LRQSAQITLGWPHLFHSSMWFPPFQAFNCQTREKSEILINIPFTALVTKWKQRLLDDGYSSRRLYFS